MKFTDIKDLTVEELRKRESNLRNELTLTRMKGKMGQLASPIEIRYKRRDIARIKTALASKLK